MHIAINTVTLKSNKPSPSGLFWVDAFIYLANQYPTHHFHFIIDEADSPFAAIKGTNVSLVPLNKPIGIIAGLKFWNYFKLPSLPKKIKADVTIQLNGYCSLATKTPQLLVIDNLLWVHHPKFLATTAEVWFGKTFTKRFVKKSKGAITLSDSLKQDLIANFPEAAGKTTAINVAAPSYYKPISYEERMQAKDGFADGREYFLFVEGNAKEKNLEGAIRAFSIFKKWQKSNMKLLIAGTITPQKNGTIEKLGSYKYKDDVVVLQNIAEAQLAQVFASAYALLLPSFYEGFSILMVAAMQAGVPVIASNQKSLMETGGDSCLFAPPNEVEELANQMKLLYKDEQLRKGLIAKGLQQASIYTIEKAAALFWGSVMDMVDVNPK